MGGLLILLFIEAGEGEYGVGANVLIGLYESERVIKVGDGGIVEDDGVVIVGEVALAHLEGESPILMLFLLY